jgi:hypothetical protein
MKKAVIAILATGIVGIGILLALNIVAGDYEEENLKGIDRQNVTGDTIVIEQNYTENQILELFKKPLNKEINVEQRKDLIKSLPKVSLDKYIDMCISGFKMKNLEDEVKFQMLSTLLDYCLDDTNVIDDKSITHFVQGSSAALGATENIKLKIAIGESLGILTNRNIYIKIFNTQEARALFVEDVLFKTGKSLFSKFGKIKVINKDYLKEQVTFLSDIDVQTRMKAALELKNATGKDFGFNPVADEQQRKEAIQRWLEYINNYPR